MGESLRVLFVNPGRDLGGAEQSLLLLIEALRSRSVEITVALFGEGPLRARLASLGIGTAILNLPAAVRRTSRYRSLRFLQTAALTVRALPGTLSLAGLARRVKADIIHSNGLKAHMLAGLAGRLLGRPVVWHLRDFPPSGFLGSAFRQALRRLPSLVFTNSDAVGRAVRSIDPENGPPIVRLYNPVDLDRFRPGLPRGRIRGELGLGDDIPLVGLVAHLTPWKGHEDFLQIARAVADNLPDARFVVAGGPIYDTDGHTGYVDLLHRRASEIGLGDRVTFLGAREDVPEVLAALDVLVHCPTSPEPFGRALAEAMAVGRPVVAADSGGIGEIVEHNVTGYLVPPRDVMGFAAAVLRLLKNPALGKQLGEAGRRRGESLFGVDAHVERVLEAYRSVTARREGTA